MDESDSALLKCDRNQNTCDDKSEPNLVIAEPSWLLDRVAALLPSNFLNLPPRWRDWFIRGQSGILLISCFCTLISLGPLGLFSLTIIVQISSYYELLQLGQQVTRVQDLRTWCWCLFAVGNAYCLDPALTPAWLSAHRKLGLCFVAYLGLVTWFVASIRHTSQCLTRYCLLGWSHMAVFYLVGAGYLLNLTLQHGMVWYIFSMSIITLNDIAAYMCGFFCGATPLIVLSPKKTVEGFLGGGLVTVGLGPLLASLLQQFPQLTSATSPGLGPEFYTGNMSPFVLHCLAISVFASTLGPVAGFFCSGFKRACNQKNFGCLIPGHGGVLDRCDCMFLMAVFTYVYLHTCVV